MLLSLAAWLRTLGPEFGFLRVVQYLTFRAVMAAMTSLLDRPHRGPRCNPPLWRRSRSASRYAVTAWKPISPRAAQPTMGGKLISCCCRLPRSPHSCGSTSRTACVWIVLAVTIGMGAIGWADDWRKVVHKDPEGMRSREKYFWQSVIGITAALYLVFSISESNNFRVIELFFQMGSSRAST